MSVKDNIRNEFRQKRIDLINSGEKASKDKEIVKMLLSSVFYINANAVFIYHSLPDEIDTLPIIKQALSDGKRVSLPVSINDEGLMKFYTITSLDVLKEGLFGIMEPDVDVCKADNDYGDAICIVPALSFDKKGYRLGYGKGYYDRFLQKFTSFSIGLCYNNFISDELPSDFHDKKVDFLITEDNILSF